MRELEDHVATLTTGREAAAAALLLALPGAPMLAQTSGKAPAIQVDETAHHEVARRLGAGVQVYDCDPAKGTFRFREPQADLYDLETLTQRGIHFVGPEPGTAQWADADGSRVVARVAARVDAPPPADPAKLERLLEKEETTPDAQLEYQQRNLMAFAATEETPYDSSGRILLPPLPIIVVTEQKDLPSIADLMAGKVAIESQLGSGTIVSVTIPVK